MLGTTRFAVRSYPLISVWKLLVYGYDPMDLESSFGLGRSGWQRKSIAKHSIHPDLDV
jgi:hypothetical protein